MSRDRQAACAGPRAGRDGDRRRPTVQMQAAKGRFQFVVHDESSEVEVRKRHGQGRAKGQTKR